MTGPRPQVRARRLLGGFGLAAVALVVVLGGSVEATHEVDHRYVVVGYIRDDAGRAVAGVTVRVVREKTGLIYHAETDAEGFNLIASTGRVTTLDDFLGKQEVVLIFYMGAG